jgi:hypothetical protein
MRTIFLAVAACFCCVSWAQAQVVVTHPRTPGKQVITEIDTPQPTEGKLPVAGKKPMEGKPMELKLDTTPSATAAIMKVRDWNFGTVFIDENCQRWRLVRGPVMVTRPKEISGWRLVTVDGEVLFFTITGRLYTSQ